MKQLIYIVFLFIFIGTDAVAQRNYTPKKKKKQHFNNSRIREPLFRWETGFYKKHGLQFNIGPTYTFTSLEKREFEIPLGDSIASGTQEAKSRLGAFVEIGMVHMTKRPRRFIHYFDWGIGFKYFGGGEETVGKITRKIDGSLIREAAGQGEFYNGYLYGRFDVHSVFQMNPYLFLDNSLGVNVDYALLPGNREYDGFHLPSTEKFQGELIAQLHYSLGVGIKPNPHKGFYFVPSIEIPVFGAYEWNGGNPQINWFSSQYFPAHLRLKFVWLFRKPADECPPVEMNNTDRQRQNEFQGF